MQHGNRQVALTARHLLEKWELILEATGANQSFSHAAEQQQMLLQPSYHTEQHQHQQQQMRPRMLSQGHLISRPLQLDSSFAAMESYVEQIAAAQEADAMLPAAAASALPEACGAGMLIGAGGTGGRHSLGGVGGFGQPGPPGRSARSASSRPAQAALYASSPNVLWPEVPPPASLTRAATVAAIPQALPGGGRARPRPQAANAAGQDAVMPAAAKRKSQGGRPKKNSGSGAQKGKLSRVQGIAALERQLEQLKKAQAGQYGNVAGFGDTGSPPGSDPVIQGSSGAWGAASAAQARAGSGSLEQYHQHGSNKTGVPMDPCQDQHSHWAAPQGAQASQGMEMGASREASQGPSLTDGSVPSGWQPPPRLAHHPSAQQHGRSGQRTATATAAGAGGSAAMGRGTTTTSDTEDFVAGKEAPTVWTDADKARYIAVLQEHGRNLTKLCAAFPNK